MQPRTSLRRQPQLSKSLALKCFNRILSPKSRRSTYLCGAAPKVTGVPFYGRTETQDLQETTTRREAEMKGNSAEDLPATSALRFGRWGSRQSWRRCTAEDLSATNALRMDR